MMRSTELELEKYFKKKQQFFMGLTYKAKVTPTFGLISANEAFQSLEGYILLSEILREIRIDKKQKDKYLG